MRLSVIALAAASLAACAAEPPATSMAPPAPTLDTIAEAYVKTSLEIGTHEDGYIDAYYGPAEWRAAAEADPRPIPALRAEVASLRAALAAMSPVDPMDAARRASLDANLRAADARMQMMEGTRFPFDEEARLLYGAAPRVRELAEFDPVLERLDALVPGEGTVGDRVSAYLGRFVIPDDKVEAAILAATADCKARTAPHIDMPEGEAFTLELVRDKVWSGYNWYKGDAQSLIQVNLDSEVSPHRAVTLGCHEGYPGHHLYNALLEQELADGKGWVEYQVYPLYSPQSLIAEGSADYGVKLAYPGNELLPFVRDTLFPIAGFDPVEAERYLAVVEAMDGLEEANPMIGRAYIDGHITAAEAEALQRKYMLRSEAQAKRTVAFADANRAYIINYVTGEQLVKQWITERVAEGMSEWDAMELLLTNPVVLTN
ncbi:hypothetical protein [Sphingomicrobium nitratireducens]|uniref:hypothetical protein n=1 Tax=Sphingomicrobium nitratireducens TaxID=2964666 RepID=UPI0022407162|nr:hypothetical protein [Sphingomicrobium nitratireducens]